MKTVTSYNQLIESMETEDKKYLHTLIECTMTDIQLVHHAPKVEGNYGGGKEVRYAEI